jgi:hypothetical protein
LLATTELHRRAQQHAGQFTVTARKLADFLTSVQSEEALHAQRLQDHEAKSVRMTIEDLAHPERGETTLTVDQQDVSDALKARIMPGTIASGEPLAFEEY